MCYCNRNLYLCLTFPTSNNFLNHITYLSWYPSPTEKSCIYLSSIEMRFYWASPTDFRRKLQEIFISVFTMWVPSNDTNIQGGSNYVVNERRIRGAHVHGNCAASCPGHRCPSYWLLASELQSSFLSLTVRWMWSKAAGTGGKSEGGRDFLSEPLLHRQLL